MYAADLLFKTVLNRCCFNSLKGKKTPKNQNNPEEISQSNLTYVYTQLFFICNVKNCQLP